MDTRPKLPDHRDRPCALWRRGSFRIVLSSDPTRLATSTIGLVFEVASEDALGGKAWGPLQEIVLTSFGRIDGDRNERRLSRDAQNALLAAFFDMRQRLVEDAWEIDRLRAQLEAAGEAVAYPASEEEITP